MSQTIAKPILFGTFIVSFLILTSSCSLTKTLSEEELLHYKTQIHIADADKPDKVKKLASRLKAIPSPKTLSGFDKLRIRYYNFLGKTRKEKGLKAWLKKNIAKAPVLLDTEKLENSRLRIKRFLFDQGYFKAGVGIDTSTSGKKVAVNYQVRAERQYFLREVYYPSDTTPLGATLAKFQEESVLREQAPYLKQNILKERNRLAKTANENGFLKVSDKNFDFFIDTIPGVFQTDIYIQIRTDEDSLKLSPYYLSDYWVYTDYSLETAAASVEPDTLNYQGLKIIQSEALIRPKILYDQILPQKDSLYAKSKADQTVNRLLNLGVYKFVNQRYEEKEGNFLDQYYDLTPGVIQDVSAEVKANTRTGNFLGTGLAFTYSHRNLFRGAERMDLSLSGEVETQIGNTQSFINSMDLGLQFNLSLPYFSPFKIADAALLNRKTVFNAGNSYQRRTQFYTLNSIDLKFGYEWRNSSQKRRQLNPLYLSRIKVFDQSPEFKRLLDENPSLRKSFEDVFIIGGQYISTYTSGSLNARGNYFFLKNSLELSGNLPWLARSVLKAKKTAGSFTFLELPFSQYVKFDTDYRYYRPVQSGLLVFRVFAGAGLAFGNLQVLPYVKQYFAGGSNGIRAFRIRNLGPGTYFNPESDVEGVDFIDQTGDLKLEFNLEYRFDMISYLKGAFFIDAGNVWLLREEEAREGGVFQFNDFYKEIAIGTGFGLRLDISSFVVRLDAAFPIRKPFLEEGRRWTMSDINFFRKKWRKENLVLNLGLGYPF